MKLYPHTECCRAVSADLIQLLVIVFTEQFSVFIKKKVKGSLLVLPVPKHDGLITSTGVC